MKKIILTIAMSLSVLSLFSQAKKPTLMVVPSDAWCNAQGYITSFDNQGSIQKLPDYSKAVMENLNLNQAISKIGELMAEKGFPLKDLANTMKSLQTEAAEESLTTSKDGDGLAESPLEKLQRTAKADIIIQLSWNINANGPQKSLSFNLQGIDAYTNKQIAASSGTGTNSPSSEFPLMLEAAIIDHIKVFTDQLQAHFDDLFENGREISVLCRRWSGTDIDFESEFDGEELGVIIEDWIADNTEQGRFSTSDMSENKIRFEQTRIPLYVEGTERATDARTWTRGLQKMLRDKYNIESKLSTKGLGMAIVTIGAK